MIISPLQLSDAVAKILEETTIEIQERVNEEAEGIAKDVCDNLKRHSPKDTGKYAKSWTVDERETKKLFTSYKHYVVKNDKRYRLTHLLEHGHLNRDGSRTPAKEHIATVERAAIREFERRVEEICKNGT